jgi:MFS family permease
MFIVGRFIAGFGGAGVATGSITIISLCAPLEKRPRKQILVCWRDAY